MTLQVIHSAYVHCTSAVTSSLLHYIKIKFWASGVPGPIIKLSLVCGLTWYLVPILYGFFFFFFFVQKLAKIVRKRINQDTCEDHKNIKTGFFVHLFYSKNFLTLPSKLKSSFLGYCVCMLKRFLIWVWAMKRKSLDF